MHISTKGAFLKDTYKQKTPRERGVFYKWEQMDYARFFVVFFAVFFLAATFFFGAAFFVFFAFFFAAIIF